MQFIDLKTQYKLIKTQMDARIQTVLEHGRYIMGPEISELETKLADYSGVSHCITCSSGTDALLMPLMAWDIGPGDAVFTTPFTFISTAEVVSLIGATSVFSDIDPVTYNLCPEKLEESICRILKEGKLKPKAIIPVDLFGLPADYDKIMNIAAKYELLVLQDAAQSFGGSVNGKKTGSHGHSAGTSFFPAKPLGGYGDGGAVFTDDDDLAGKVRSIRVHGMGCDKYNNIRIGLNARFDTLQAAVILEKLAIFSGELEKRQKVVEKYNSLLKDKLVTPFVPEGYVSAWAQYSLLADNSSHRSSIIETLNDNQIPTAIYYPVPLHLQDAFSGLGYNKGDIPVSENISERIFSLPMHPYLTDADIEHICSYI